ATGLMAAARAARYRLLAAWCQRHDILHLATAHHADDQAETVVMREAHGSRPYGLAGMAAIRPLAGVRPIRPLLGWRKPQLQQIVPAAGLSWIEDPSNQATRFERVRWRRELARNGDPLAICQRAAAAGLARDRAEREVAALLAQGGRIDPAGFLTIDRDI